jgi:hypothetical protein
MALVMGLAVFGIIAWQAAGKVHFGVTGVVTIEENAIHARPARAGWFLFQGSVPAGAGAVRAGFALVFGLACLSSKASCKISKYSVWVSFLLGGSHGFAIPLSGCTGYGVSIVSWNHTRITHG